MAVVVGGNVSMVFFGLAPSEEERSVSSVVGGGLLVVAVSGVRRNGTGCRIFGSVSKATFWKSKFTGFGPGDETLLVGLSMNFVHSFAVSLVWGDKIGSVSGLTEDGVSFPGINCGGRTSGNSM